MYIRTLYICFNFGSFVLYFVVKLQYIDYYISYLRKILNEAMWKSSSKLFASFSFAYCRYIVRRRQSKIKIFLTAFVHKQF